MSENIVATQIIEQARSWKARALAAEDALELAREQARYRESELVRSGHQQLLEAQAKALDTIQRIAAQLPLDPIIDAEVVVPDVEVDTWFGEDDTPVVQIDTKLGHGRLRINLNDGVVWDGDPETDERPGKNAELIEWEQRALAQAETISRQLDTIRDQAEKIEHLEDQLKLAVQHGQEHEARTNAAENQAAELRQRIELRAKALRLLEARKVELEAEVLAERGALAVCQTKLTDAKAALAESERAFSAIDAARAELAAELRQARDGIDRQAGEINETASARDWWKAEHAAAVKRINDANDAKAEAIAHCNEQLTALSKAATLRDRQVHTLGSLWRAKTDDERALFGTVFTRQLYRVFADHGIDVEHDTARYVLRLVGGKAGPVPEQPVTDRIIREHNHLREHAELVLQADMRNRGRFLGDGLRSALAGLRDAVNNGAPDPTPDIADCA